MPATPSHDDDDDDDDGGGGGGVTMMAAWGWNLAKDEQATTPVTAQLIE